VITANGVLEGYEDVQRILEGLPDKLVKGPFTRAGRRVAINIANQATRNTPRRAVEGKDGLGHLQDRFTYKQKAGATKGATIFVVGSASGAKNKINHLVEDGTKARFTGFATQYKTIRGGEVTKLRRYRTATGAWRTERIKVQRNKKVSAGSFRRTGADRSFVSAQYRGVMPAFHQLQKAGDSTPVNTLMTEELRAGLIKLADKTSSAG
jgi:hypothetical protein